MRKCTESVRQAEADRRADMDAMNATLFKAASAQKGEVPLLQSQLKKTAERVLQVCCVDRGGATWGRFFLGDAPL